MACSYNTCYMWKQYWPYEGEPESSVKTAASTYRMAWAVLTYIPPAAPKAFQVTGAKIDGKQVSESQTTKS